MSPTLADRFFAAAAAAAAAYLGASAMSYSATPWIIARQVPLSMAFSRQDTGVGCHALLQVIFPTQTDSLLLVNNLFLIRHNSPRDSLHNLHP